MRTYFLFDANHSHSSKEPPHKGAVGEPSRDLARAGCHFRGPKDLAMVGSGYWRNFFSPQWRWPWAIYGGGRQSSEESHKVQLRQLRLAVEENGEENIHAGQGALTSMPALGGSHFMVQKRGRNPPLPPTFAWSQQSSQGRAELSTQACPLPQR